MVIVEDVGQMRRVADASPCAIQEGVRCGMSLAEARAMCPGLECAGHDPTGDRQKLEALGRWMTRFTPVVAIGWDEASPHVLFLDVTGCERLFGGTENIVRLVTRALKRFRIPARMAVAPTVGAAWGFALRGGRQIVREEELRRALAGLPLQALRMGEDVIDALHGLGLRTVGQVMELPREQLPARFGAELLLRLDQATGDRPELLTPLAYRRAVEAWADFEFAVESLETIGVIFETLLDRVVEEMVGRGLGARRLELVCVPDRSAGRSSVTKEIALARACRDRKTLLNLIRGGVEQIGCDGGFVAFRLKVSTYERIAGGEQAAAFGERDEAESLEVECLVDRLRLRLGEAAVVRPVLVESFLPERAWRAGGECGASVLAGAVRPICLLPTPAEIRVICEPSDDRTGSPRQFTEGGNVHRLTHAVGPERIGGEWWRGHDKVRDYYNVEDEAGRRFWIFRAVLAMPTRWFLHGRFQ